MNGSSHDTFSLVAFSTSSRGAGGSGGPDDQEKYTSIRF